MNLGKTVRLQRIFCHPFGRLCSVPVDHFVGCQAGLPSGLSRMAEVVAKVAAGRPEAITMLKGVAKSVFPSYGDHIPLIISWVCHHRADRHSA